MRAVCPGRVAIITIQKLDLIIKWYFLSNVLMPGQRRRQWSSIEPILRVLYGPWKLLNATFIQFK